MLSNESCILSRIVSGLNVFMTQSFLLRDCVSICSSEARLRIPFEEVENALIPHKLHFQTPRKLRFQPEFYFSNVFKQDSAEIKMFCDNIENIAF